MFEVNECYLFVSEKQVWWKKRDVSVRMKFPITATHQVEVENAQLRILAPPQPQGPTTVRVQVNQLLGGRRKRMLEERTFYLSKNFTKWCEVDVTSAVQSWLSGDINLGLELVCLDCESSLSPYQAAITSLIYPDIRRVRRSSPYQSERRTDCQKGKRKKKCCRQNMKVNFTKLEFPEMNFIVEPKTYEAGYCHGLCPPNYNHATNHSRIQSLMHQMERKNAKIANRKIIPKACCAPSKLGPLEILLINKDDPTKLLVEKWDNMVVIECACS